MGPPSATGTDMPLTASSKSWSMNQGVLFFVNALQEIDQHRGVVKETQFGLI
jgi:hypothetical protein